ncbi:MAG: glucose-6-phosphate isomerase [Campylobacterales bacterium]|nr:glucose-6-phosphate isomerase [Campylobacterales bacterium]
MKNSIYFDISKNELEAKKRLFDAILEEKKYIGYYDLPFQDINALKKYENKLGEDIDTIVVVGIGGSSLGTKAIYEFLKPAHHLKRELFFLESTDPLNLTNQIKNIDFKRSHFLIISKSGTTIETISIFKYLYSLNNDANKYTFITDPNSPLEDFAQTIDASYCNIPKNVGGRFSVLSSTGLLPLLFVGVDISSILEGAKKISDGFLNAKDIKDHLIDKALFYAKNYTTYHINCIFAYSEALKYFCEWYVQLWGESLGKKQKNSAINVGLTPVGLIGPRDQHSFLQLLIEGTRDKSATFIKIDDFKDELKIPDISLAHLEELDNINGISFHRLINMQCESTLEALRQHKDIPLDAITIQSIDAQSIGELIYYYELLTSLVGILIDVDTYNQPGVEEGKVILKNKLKKAKK